MTRSTRAARKDRGRAAKARSTGNRPAASPFIAGPAWIDESWWAARGSLVLVAAAVVALAVRAVYFLQLSSSPCLSIHRWSQTDMAFFDSWGRAIAAGDALSTGVEPPYHGWHATLAELYLRDDPATARELEAEAARSGVEPGALLWRRWAGGGRFYQEPLYPYLIAATYSALSPDPRWMIAMQLALGVGSTLLVLLLTRRLFGHRAAAAAALLACLGAPWIYLEAVLVRTSLLVFSGLALVLLLDAVRSRPGAIFLTGLAFGAAAMLQSTFLLLAAGAVVLVPAAMRMERPARAAAALAAGVIAGISPLVIRNIAAGAPPLAFASGGAVNFIVSNAYDPGVEAMDFRGTHVARIMAATRGAFLPTVVMTLGTHPSPFAYMANLAGKLASVAHWYEAPDNTSFYYFRLHAGVLRLLFVNFTVLAPLAAAGIVLAARREAARRAPLFLLAGVNLVVLLAFMVIDRFRAPLAFSLMPFAGHALAETADGLRARRYARVVAAAALALVLAAVIARPLPRGAQKIRAADYWAPYEAYYEPRVREAGEERGDWAAAARILEESLQYEPRRLAALGPSRPAKDPAEAEIAALFADVRDRHAQTLELSGRSDAADAERRRAAELRAAAAASERTP